MDEFLTSSFEFLQGHRFLFDFKMTQVLLRGRLDHPFFLLRDDQVEMIEFVARSEQLTTVGESLLVQHHPSLSISSVQRPRKCNEKKFQQIVHFCEFLIEKIPPDGDNDNKECAAIVDVGSGVGHLPTLLTKYFNNISAVEVEERYLVNYPPTIRTKCIKLTDDNVERELRGFAEPNSALVGLHSCGQLSRNVVSTFANSEHFTTLALISCCYHKMNDFRPLSSLLAGRFPGQSFQCGLLRLASQRRGEQFFTKKGIEVEVNHVFERALKEREVEATTDFDMYKARIATLLKAQAAIQRLSELLVLLDRCVYLKEKGYEPQVYSRVLPESSSPRGEVLYCSKKS